MQDSLAFHWQIDPKAPLQQIFVEKGANTPSNVGTHDVADCRWISLDRHIQHLWRHLRVLSRAKSFPGLSSNETTQRKRLVCRHRVQWANAHLASREKRIR